MRRGGVGCNLYGTKPARTRRMRHTGSYADTVQVNGVTLAAVSESRALPRPGIHGRFNNEFWGRTIIIGRTRGNIADIFADHGKYGLVGRSESVAGVIGTLQ